MTPGDEQPARFEALTLNNGPADPTPKASNILRYSAEVIEAIQVQDNSRDKAIVEEANLLDMIVDGEVTAQDLRALRKLEPAIKQRSDLFERLDAYIRHAEQVTV